MVEYFCRAWRIDGSDQLEEERPRVEDVEVRLGGK